MPFHHVLLTAVNRDLGRGVAGYCFGAVPNTWSQNGALTP
jgi:hypothetical protein